MYRKILGSFVVIFFIAEGYISNSPTNTELHLRKLSTSEDALIGGALTSYSLTTGAIFASSITLSGGSASGAVTSTQDLKVITGRITLSAAGNVIASQSIIGGGTASIPDSAGADVNVAFSPAFSAAPYVVVSMTRGGSGDISGIVLKQSTPATTSLVVFNFIAAGTGSPANLDGAAANIIIYFIAIGPT